MADDTSSHGAHHHHHGGHGHQHFTAANEEYFDKMSKDYEDKPQIQEFARRISKAMREKYPSLFDEDRTALLDYACGPGEVLGRDDWTFVVETRPYLSGMVSRELCSYVKSVVGVDISQGMVDQFNRRVEEQGIPPEEMKAVKAELKGEETELEGAKFDVIIVSALRAQKEAVYSPTPSV